MTENYKKIYRYTEVINKLKVNVKFDQGKEIFNKIDFLFQHLLIIVVRRNRRYTNVPKYSHYNIKIKFQTLKRRSYI